MVPLVTEIPAGKSPVTGSEKVNVKMIGDVLNVPPAGVTATVGAVLSMSYV